MLAELAASHGGVTPTPLLRSADPTDPTAPDDGAVGALLQDLHRVGKRLRPPLDDGHGARRGTHRVVDRIDEATHTVTVPDVAHRRDAYRTGR
ncbi:type II toxin-antitoxin system RelE family toxin [Geodermatophilus sp. SYSU D00710]